MTDQEILAALYKLQTLDADKRDAFIESWIRDTLIDIAKNAQASVGLGDPVSVLSHYIKLLRRKADTKQFAGMIQCGIGRHYVFFRPPDKGMSNEWFVLSKGDLKLPVIAAEPASLGDICKSMLRDARERCTETVYLPPRSTLSAYINQYKALPKATRPEQLLWDLGKGYPKVDAQSLFDLLAIFPYGQAKVIPGKETSSLYFEWSTFEGLLSSYKGV